MTDQEAKNVLATSRTIATIGAVLLFIVGLVVQVWGQAHSSSAPAPSLKVLKAVILSMWFVLPPIWFWFEYHIFFRHLSADERQSLKEYQEVSRNVWAGAAALFGLIYFKEAEHAG
jgi:hypothetical protein